MAFCTSLRRRPPFAAVVPALTMNNFLREYQLDTHDIGLPLAQQRPPDSTQPRQLRFLLLSPCDADQDALSRTMARIRRFGALTGGPDLAIVFSMAVPENAARSSLSTEAQGVIQYSRLQVEILSQQDLPQIPILPLATLSHLPVLLRKYKDTILRQQNMQRSLSIPSAFEVMRQCTTKPPIEESMAYFITDIFVDLRELADVCYKASPADLENTISTEGPSPYFSSSSENRQASQEMSKLRRLKAFNAAATVDIVRFWQAKSMV